MLSVPMQAPPLPQSLHSKNNGEPKFKDEAVGDQETLGASTWQVVLGEPLSPTSCSLTCSSCSIFLYRMFSENRDKPIVCSSSFLEECQQPAGGEAWFGCPLFCLCHRLASLASLAFQLLYMSPFHFDLPLLAVFNRPPSGLTFCQKPCTWKTVR